MIKSKKNPSILWGVGELYKIWFSTKYILLTPPLSLSQEVKQNIKLVQKKTWNYDIIIQKYIKK